jgi:hypothetical protein
MICKAYTESITIKAQYEQPSTTDYRKEDTYGLWPFFL